MEIIGILGSLALTRALTKDIGWSEFERGVAAFCLMWITAEALAWWRF